MSLTAPFLPVSDAHLPLAERQFPYRAANSGEVAAANAACGKALESVDRLLYQIARKRFASGCESDIDDLVQYVRFSLWRCSLPRFDRHRGFKLTTFIHRCATNYTIRRVRVMLNARRRQPLSLDSCGDGRDTLAARRAARDTAEDRAVERAADAILAAPESFMSEYEARAVRALVNAGPGVTSADVCRQAGLRDAYTISKTIGRARKRIRQSFDLYGDYPASRSRRPLTGVLRELYMGRQMTLAQIGQQYGVRPATVSSWLKASAIPTRFKNTKPEGAQR